MEHHLTTTECHLPYGITVLPATRHKWTHPAFRLHRSQSGRYSIYLPRRDGRLSRPWWLVMYTEMVYPPAGGHPSSVD